MSKKDIIYLSKDEVSILKETWPPKKFAQDFSIFYRGQIPPISFLLVDGEVEIKRYQKREKVNPFHIIAFTQCLHAIPIKAQATIKSHSRACLIDKVSAMEYLQLEGYHPVTQVLQKILQSF